MTKLEDSGQSGVSVGTGRGKAVSVGVGAGLGAWAGAGIGVAGFFGAISGMLPLAALGAYIGHRLHRSVGQAASEQYATKSTELRARRAKSGQKSAPKTKRRGGV